MISSSEGRRLLLLAAVAAPVLAAAMSAQAQTSGASVAAASAPAPQEGTGEVVVTATRTSQALSKVAASVSAFTARQLDVLDVKSFADLAKFTPGVTFDPERHDIAIRGISSKAGSGVTGIYIDDTPIQVRALGLNANNALPSVFDLDRVEVLRGPQGTLFGAGSEGGAVRYITPQPSLRTFSATARTETAFTQGGAPSFEAGAAVGGPLVEDVLGLRLSAWSRRDGGWIDRAAFQTLTTTRRSANDVDTTVLRLAASIRPAPAVTFTPSVLYQNRVQGDADSYWLSMSNPDQGVLRTGTPDQMADKDHFLLSALRVDYEAPFAKIVSNTAYYVRTEHVNGYSGTLYNLSYFQQLTAAGVDPQGNPCPRCAADPQPLLTAGGPNLPGFGSYVAVNLTKNIQRDFSQEIRLQSRDPDARLGWIAGVFYADGVQESQEEIRDPQLGALTSYLFGETVPVAWGEGLLPNGDDYLNKTTGRDRQAALFLDGTYALTRKLKLEVGFRYSWTDFDSHNLNDGPQDLLDNGGAPATSHGGRDEQPFTPKGGVTYQITRDDMVYATAAEGYRVGGATPALPPLACGGVFPTLYNSDKAMSYEVGTKDRLLERTLSVSASAFYITWNNIQQAVYVPQCGIQYTANLGDAVSRGVDVQWEWRPLAHLVISAALGYVDARLTTDAVQTLGGRPVVLARRGDAIDAPPVTAALGLQYGFGIAGHEVSLRADYEYAGHRTRPLPAEDPGISPTFYDAGLRPNPATNQVSARLGVGLAQWDLALFAENLLDAHPRLDLAHQDQNTALFEATTLRPRTVGLSAVYRY